MQKLRQTLSGNNISKVNNQIAIIFRCTGRDDVKYESLRQHNHKFSFVLTLEEVPSNELANHSLYDEISLCNVVENITEAEADIEIDV